MSSEPAKSNYASAAWGPRRVLAAIEFDWRVFLTGLGLLGLFLLFLGTVQFSTPNLSSTDGYFHIKFAEVMRDQGLRPPFPWLPLTILNPQDYADHHFLFHVLLIPYTYGDLRLGAKWSGVIFPTMAFLMGWLFLRGQRVRYAALWAVGFLAVSEAFLYRLSMPRVQAVSLLMMFLILHVVLTGRERWLFPLTFIYVWLYDGFPLIVLIVGCYTLSRWLLEGQLRLWPLAYVGLGVILGLVINPYFPQYVIFVYHHMLPKLTESSSASVGNEWYPYETWTLVENSAGSLVVMVAGVVALGLSQRRMSTSTGTLLLVALLFGFLLFKSRRFIEYYPAFALLFCASAWNVVLEEWRPAKPWSGKVAPVLLALLLLPALAYNYNDARASLEDTNPYQRYADASAWLIANTPPGSLLYQTDWDDFSQLYFYNTHNTYTLGLDPTYMELYRREMYELWRDIGRGRVSLPSQPIASTFGCKYILTDLKHQSFLDEAAMDPGLEEVYRDDYAVIFRVRDSAAVGRK